MMRPGAALHDQDAVGKKDRLVHIMGDEHNRRAEALPDIKKAFLHHQPGLRVKTRRMARPSAERNG
jgi:hypothetical protein